MLIFNPSFQPFGFDHVLGAYIALGAGLVLAVFSIAVEVAIKGNKNRNVPKMVFPQSYGF